MQGDFTRLTFDPQHGYRSVLLQQGRVLLDADWNDQAEITAHHDETRTRDIVGDDGGPTDGAGFLIVDATTGGSPAGTAWSDLRLTAGDYYVDGVLCEPGPGPGPGEPAPTSWALADQPYLPSIESEPGLPEPTGDGRYAVYLDVWTHHVTADEAPSLREPALGGPDTTTRAQTVWQARVLPIDDDLECSDLYAPEWPFPEAGTMVASLQDETSDPDPCRITTTGGYSRLENQLYRVQIHDTPAGERPRFLWSRENGSVVAGLAAIGDTTTRAADVDLVLDRAGRDEELSFREGDTVEVTSTDRQLRGQPGYLGVVGVPDELRLPVTWSDDAPGTLASLGRAPIVRRWEGPARRVSPNRVDLEGGIQVRFPTGGSLVSGDYWLIPARTVRLAYGLTALSGTIEWPANGGGDPVPLPPHGPVHHASPLAILVREAEAWSLDSDCRRLFPQLTEMVTLDLLGGDGQEALPGEPLAQPVRVAVRNGGLPVADALVRFATIPPGHIADSVPTGASPDEDEFATDDHGVAAVRWLLDPTGPHTQVLTVVRLDDRGDEIGPGLAVTARLSIASQVAWDPVCEEFRDTRTVQDALSEIVLAKELRLLGGDGQHALGDEVLPQPVRVLVDSICGPVAEERVRATGSESALVQHALDGESVPSSLVGTGSTVADAPSGSDGTVSFWWQPDFSRGTSDVLEIHLPDDPRGPVRVTAQLLPKSRGGRTGGLHIERLSFLNGDEFLNDSFVRRDSLASGISIELSGEAEPDSVVGKPVARVLLDLPWPVKSDGEFWSGRPIGFRTVELAADLHAEGTQIVWTAAKATHTWLVDALPKLSSDPLVGRLVVDGWAIISRENPQHHLNGHAFAELEDGRTRLRLPTDDEVAGGPFVQWFRLAMLDIGGTGRGSGTPTTERVKLPSVDGFTKARAFTTLESEGFVPTETAEPSDTVRKNSVIRTRPRAGTKVEPGRSITLVVSSGRPR